MAMSAMTSLSDRISALMSAPGRFVLRSRIISTNSGTASGFVRFPPITGTSLALRASVCDVNVDIVDGAMLPPLILPVLPVRPLLPLWDTADGGVCMVVGIFRSSATGQLIVTFNEQLRMSPRSVKRADSGSPLPT